MARFGSPSVKLPPGLDRPRQRRLGQALRARRGLRIGTVQLIYVAGGVGLGFLVPRIAIGSTVSSSKATEVLVAVGAGFVPFIGIVYSLLFLVVQFGSTTFTPRLSLFRDDPIVWRAFSFFTSVIVFAFTATFAIGSSPETTALVPIVLSIAVLGAIALLRALQTAAFKSIQLASTLEQVLQRGRGVIDGVYPESVLPTADAPGVHEHHAPRGAQAPDGSREVLWPGRFSILQVVDVPRLLRLAERENALIRLCVGAGETLTEKSRIPVLGGGHAPLDREVVKAFRVGVERSFEQDPALALRVLADIALRALSPAVNDPTTAVQTLDAIDDLLRALATRDLAVQSIHGADGTPRLVLKLPAWEDYLSVAVDEIISMGFASIQVRQRVRRLLEELLLRAPPPRSGPIEDRLKIVRASAGHPANGGGDG